MTRLFGPTVLLIACASLAGAQPLPSALDPPARTSAVEDPPPFMTGLAVGMDDALRDDRSAVESAFTKASAPTGRGHGDSLLNGALIGAGVGTVLCVVYFHEEVPAASLPLIVGFYALAGAWIDAKVEAVTRAGIGASTRTPAGRPGLRATVSARMRF